MAKPIGVGGGANRAPTAVSLSNSAVGENALGAQIGILTTTDPNKNDKIAYQVLQTKSSGNLLLVAGQPVVDTRFSVDAAGNLSSHRDFRSITKLLRS